MVESNKVAEYRAAVGSATEKDERGRDVAPLSYVFVSNVPYGSYLLDEVVQLDYSKTLLGTVEWEYYAPVLVGDVLEGVTSVADIEQRQSKEGRMRTFLTIETKLYRKESLVLVNRALFVETA
ncbi:MAG: MaoC family dehydratase N-terminal domain-containing protein [Firmicutes bacterium]|nr:MaoC family dehydratase N-terminal domain-containing protein [Bacillota bacterium]